MPAPGRDTIFDALETERRHLETLLQREVIDPLALLLAQVRVYEQSLAGNPNARMALSVVAALAQQVLQQARDMGDRLAPAALDPLGPSGVLESLAAQMMRAYGLRVVLSAPRQARRLPQRTELLLVRVAQAALDRCAREAGAQQVQIRLHYHDQQVELLLSDDGRPDAGVAGLERLRHEVESAGGHLEIDATPHGTHLRLLADDTPTDTLTEREQEVCALLIQGRSNKQIAMQLSVTPRTLNFHLNHIYAKLRVQSWAEAIAMLLRGM